MSQTNTSDALSFIARTFAEAYYGLLVDGENFSKLHTFYQLDAVFTRGDEAVGQDDASTTTGLEGIKKELAVFHNQVRNSEVTLKVMDSQYSVNQGIVITAVGSFNRLEGATVKTRRFVQTFFLEAQTPNNYSIRNDILRYLNESSQQVVVAAKEEVKSQSATTAPTTTASTNGATETHTTTTAPVAESNGDAKKQPQDKKKPAAAGSPTTARKARPNRKGDDKKAPRETKPEQGQEQPAAAKPPKPTTYATIVSGNAAPSAPAAPAATKLPAKPAAPKKQTPPQQQQQQGQNQLQQQQQQVRPKEKKPKQEREGHSVYVGNLPFEVKSDQVYNLFAGFGTIKDVALKRGYGFVDLTSAEDLKKIVDYFAEHPVELDGRPLVIEDRKRGPPAKPNAPRPQGQGQSQPKPAGAKRPKTSTGTNKSNDNAAH